MGKFNSTLVAYLDVLNKVIAGVFVGVAVFKFIDLISEYNFVAAVLESISVLGIGVLTCGYIALMLNINVVLEQIRDNQRK
jgi:hypothetical protein